MKVLIWVKECILHFIRRVLQILFSFGFVVISLLIYGITFEPKTKGKATRRKAKRIRILTKFKLYLYKWFGGFFDFIHYTYLKELYKNFSFLIEKK